MNSSRVIGNKGPGGIKEWGEPKLELCFAAKNDIPNGEFRKNDIPGKCGANGGPGGFSLFSLSFRFIIYINIQVIKSMDTCPQWT
ncbi:MAG: hypothetical protein ACTSVI_01095 [Promethearchaeota archaeon]